MPHTMLARTVATSALVVAAALAVPAVGYADTPTAPAPADLAFIAGPTGSAAVDALPLPWNTIPLPWVGAPGPTPWLGTPDGPPWIGRR